MQVTNGIDGSDDKGESMPLLMLLLLLLYPASGFYSDAKVTIMSKLMIVFFVELTIIWEPVLRH